jgi:RNA polymerase sigma factor (sigma-70 family)
LSRPGGIWVKMMIDAAKLLRRYVKDGSHEAFEELVSRHSGLVYSAALRQVRSPELAQEVAQSVFVTLAQKAGRLPDDVILAGWLYRATWFSATKVARQEHRRQLREQGSLLMNAHATEEESVWKQIEPHLDDAMEKLGETDRTALVLRYLENKSLREVGLALGTNEDAAQKRVARALEKLRTLFTRRKIGVSSTALAGAMSTFGIEAAPVLLKGAVISAVSAAGAATVGGGLIATTLTHIMTITKTKIAIATGVAVVAIRVSSEYDPVLW